MIKRAAEREVRHDYYVLLCACRYAATAKRLASAASDDERQQHRQVLRYLLGSGLIEVQREHERRIRRFPDDLRRALVEKDGSVISRAISLREAAVIQEGSSIPPIASIDELSGRDMDVLADIFEGWAQSDLTDCVNVARLLGWAEGLRKLALAVGIDYMPPAKAAGWG